jgi:hypothetical protein
MPLWLGSVDIVSLEAPTLKARLTLKGDQYNYTGWIVSMSTSGKFLSGYSTSAGAGAPPQDGTWNGGGGGCGVWMAGMVGSALFLVFYS